MAAGKKKVRWGILGVAKINDRLIPALQKAANVELRAIASRSLDRARAAAAAAGIPLALGGYQELLDDPEIDAVYNPLPNSLHAEWSIKAAERGKHVLCEKPLAADAALAQQVVDCFRARRLNLMDGFMWPHHPRTALLRKFLDDGGIGRVMRLTAGFTFPMDRLDTRNIRLQPDLAGGSVMDVGCYPVYLARWVFQAEPVRVYAAAEWLNGVDVRMDGMLEFPENRTALFDCGFTLPYRVDAELVGTAGRIVIPAMWLPPFKAVFLVYRPDGSGPEEFAVKGEDQIVNMVAAFSQAILEGRPASPGPEEAVATQRVLDALRLSARERRPVEPGPSTALPLSMAARASTSSTA